MKPEKAPSGRKCYAEGIIWGIFFDIFKRKCAIAHGSLQNEVGLDHIDLTDFDTHARRIIMIWNVIIIWPQVFMY